MKKTILFFSWMVFMPFLFKAQIKFYSNFDSSTVLPAELLVGTTDCIVENSNYSCSANNSVKIEPPNAVNSVANLVYTSAQVSNGEVINISFNFNQGLQAMDLKVFYALGNGNYTLLATPADWIQYPYDTCQYFKGTIPKHSAGVTVKIRLEATSQIGGAFSIDNLSIVQRKNLNLQPSLINQNLGWGTDMVVYNNDLYYSDFRAGKIKKVSLASTNAAPVDVLTGLSSPSGLAIVGNMLYYVETSNAPIQNFVPNSGRLSKYNLTATGKTATLVYDGLNFPSNLATDGTNFYIDENTYTSQGSFMNANLSKLTMSGVPSKSILKTSNSTFGDIEFSNNKVIFTEFKTGKINSLDGNTLENRELFNPMISEEMAGKLYIHNDMLYFGGQGLQGYVYGLRLDSADQDPIKISEKLKVNDLDFTIDEIGMDAAGNLLVFGNYLDLLNASTINALFAFPQTQLSTKDNNANRNVRIYPNPTDAILYISENINNVQIIDANGRMLEQADGKLNRINVRKYAKGIYFIKGRTASGQPFIQKFIKK